jgi:antitoxin component of RelBE/YafQ-DinJ toxin-antitoxin module
VWAGSGGGRGSPSWAAGFVFQGLPFDVRIPNAVTLRTSTETDAGENNVPCENAQDMFARLGI